MNPLLISLHPQQGSPHPTQLKLEAQLCEWLGHAIYNLKNLDAIKESFKIKNLFEFSRLPSEPIVLCLVQRIVKHLKGQEPVLYNHFDKIIDKEMQKHSKLFSPELGAEKGDPLFIAFAATAETLDQLNCAWELASSPLLQLKMLKQLKADKHPLLLDLLKHQLKTSGFQNLSHEECQQKLNEMACSPEKQLFLSHLIEMGKYYNLLIPKYKTEAQEALKTNTGSSIDDFSAAVAKDVLNYITPDYITSGSSLSHLADQYPHLPASLLGELAEQMKDNLFPQNS
ncbi:Alpha-actinin-3 [Candidatus Protochlamydia naegleriophila]|uniref:Alpha-actinin-3 n=1 Tax=Candidatus Protochlamydia naegleriophila TaxID=389348 RepID=A0A0U5JB68_9BACT|nr:hypothetical protein [Candidatus Protochlamydia naegleriophila]CUI16333.1 Alpha-actinin-3 [Candidatus Protochlamydia naegleriophila]